MSSSVAKTLIKTENPFAFKPYDDKMKRDQAVNYLPPKKR